jgi:hypothetical protein
MDNITGTLYITNVIITLSQEPNSENYKFETKLYFDREKSGKNICATLNKYIKPEDNYIIIYNPTGPIKYKYDTDKKLKCLRSESLKHIYGIFDITPEIHLNDNISGYRFKINKFTVKTELTNIINTNNKNKLNPINTILFRDNVYIPKYSKNKFETVQNIMNLIK